MRPDFVSPGPLFSRAPDFAKKYGGDKYLKNVSFCLAIRRTLYPSCGEREALASNQCYIVRSALTGSTQVSYPKCSETRTQREGQQSAQNANPIALIIHSGSGFEECCDEIAAGTNGITTRMRGDPADPVEPRVGAG